MLKTKKQKKKSRLSRIKPKIVSFNVSQYVFLKNYRDKEKNISDIKKVVLIGDCLITSVCVMESVTFHYANVRP